MTLTVVTSITKVLRLTCPHGIDIVSCGFSSTQNKKIKDSEFQTIPNQVENNQSTKSGALLRH